MKRKRCKYKILNNKIVMSKSKKRKLVIFEFEYCDPKMDHEWEEYHGKLVLEASNLDEAFRYFIEAHPGVEVIVYQVIIRHNDNNRPYHSIEGDEIVYDYFNGTKCYNKH